MNTLKHCWVIVSLSAWVHGVALAKSAPDYVYYQQSQIDEIHQQLEANNPIYVDALKQVNADAQKILALPLDSVVNKPKPAPSGDLHDYLSLAPYFWPDPTIESGLPWIRKDGQVNPLTRGKNTDQKRAMTFLYSLGTLFVAYTYTENKHYANKMRAMINTWMVDPTTRMNPHLNYAQGIPSVNSGRPFGVIEWEKISHVISAMQILRHHNELSPSFVSQVDNWLEEYLTWLLTSELGIMAGSLLNNHGSWYDYQVVGLMLYLGKLDQAKQHLEVTRSRIGQQILADGSQPHELKRTKSVNYTSMNLAALVHVAYMGSKVGVDLWQHKGQDGQNLEQAIQYFYPYLRGEKTWQYQQLNGVQAAFNRKTYPMLSLTHALIPDYTMPKDIMVKANKAQPALDILRFNVHPIAD